MKVMTVTFGLRDKSEAKFVEEAMTALAQSEDIHLLEFGSVKEASKRQVKLAEEISLFPD